MKLQKARRSYPQTRPACMYCGKTLRPSFRHLSNYADSKICDHVLSSGKRCDESQGAHQGWMHERHEFVHGSRTVRITLPSTETDEVLWFGHYLANNLFCSLRCGVNWAVERTDAGRKEVRIRHEQLESLNANRPSQRKSLKSLGSDCSECGQKETAPVHIVEASTLRGPENIFHHFRKQEIA